MPCISFKPLQFGQPQFGKNGEFSAEDAHDVITGGTFDPPHHGHIAVAEASLGFVPSGKAMLVMPVGHPGYKPGASCFADRFEMTKRAFVPNVYQVTDFEYRLA